MNYKNLQALLQRRFSIPKERSIRKTIRSFTLAEKAVFYFFTTIFILTGSILLYKANQEFLVEVPIRGGTFVEGVIGNPRFINPVLAVSEADRNLTTLIYSGLLRITPEGKVENNLAESLDISNDGLKYTVVLRSGAVFHDRNPVTADDVLFTIQKVTDPLIKSPKRGNWEGVTVEKIDDHKIVFSLKKAYAPFIENLTLGILPKHMWKNVSEDEFSFSQFNTLPIGTGPYKVDIVERNSGGIPNYYQLSPFEKTVGKTPFIETLIFRFYPSEETLLDAYKGNEIESLGSISPEKSDLVKNGSKIISSPLPRVFAVFFNQGQSKALASKDVRLALDLVAPKEEIVADVLKGFGTPVDGPLPAGIFAWSSSRTKETYEERFKKAELLLTKAGWKKNAETNILEKKSGSSKIVLSFSLSTGDAAELQAVANKLADAWRKLGAEVDVQIFETGDLNQNVIRPRKFEALLFGEVIGRDADIYPFWHSSQRNDPGLNIALYANARADKLLEDIRTTSDSSKLEKSLKAFSNEVVNDMPAVFLYTPSYLYILPDKVNHPDLGLLSTPQDRFLGIGDWYMETNKVWKIFVD